MFVETYIFSGNKRIYKMFWDLVERDICPVLIEKLPKELAIL
jgi:hypothetical protein